MDNAQGGITVTDGIDDDPDCEQIVDLVQGLALVMHLFVNAEVMLDTAVDPGLDAGSLYMLAYVGHDLGDVLFTFGPASGHLIDQVEVNIGMEIFEGQIVQFHLDLGNAQPGCQGRIDVQGLLGDADLLVGGHMAQCSHVVETVGQLDHDDPDILGHGQEHLSQVSGLHLLLQGVYGAVFDRKLQLFQLCHTVYQLGHVVSEHFCQLLFGINGILHHIVEKACRYGLLVHFQVCQDDGHLKGMNDIRLPRFPGLVLMGLFRQLIGLGDQGNVIGGMISAHTFDQVL